MRLVLFLRPLLLVAALAACSAGKPEPAGPGPGDLTGTNWELTRWQESERSLRPIPHAETGDPLTLAFGQTAGKPTLSGFAGCNDYTAGYSVTGDRMSVRSIVKTRKACLTPQRNQIETDYLGALDDGVTATRAADTSPPELRLKTEKGQTLVFQQR